MEIFFDIFLINLQIQKKEFSFYIYSYAGFVLHKKKSLKESIKFIFNPKVFFSKSATSDYKVFFINQVIMLLISPHLLTQITIDLL